MMRVLLTVIGMIASLAWAVLFVRAPGAALEILLFVSPVVVAVWLVVALSAPHRRPPRPRAPAGEGGDGRAAAPAPAAAGGRCAVCGAAAMTVAARRPRRRAERDPLERFISLCARCAADSVLPSVSPPGDRLPGPNPSA